MARLLTHHIPHPRFLSFAGLLGVMFALLLGYGVRYEFAFVAAFDVAALAYIAAAGGLWRSATDREAMAKDRCAIAIGGLRFCFPLPFS